MAPEVIACDENPDATYDYRVRVLFKEKAQNIHLQMSMNYGSFWDFLCFVGVITILYSYILITKVQG